MISERLAVSEPSQRARSSSATPLFAGLGEHTLRAMARLCVTGSLDARETLFQKDDTADALYAVRRGEIRIATGADDGRERTLDPLGPGDVSGEVAVLDGRRETVDRPLQAWKRGGGVELGRNRIGRLDRAAIDPLAGWDEARA